MNTGSKKQLRSAPESDILYPYRQTRKAGDSVKLVIQQTEYGAEPKFCVRNEQTAAKAVSLPDPVSYPVAGYPDKRLLRELAWYLEQYLEFPAGADAKRAQAVVDTLRNWGGEVFDALFSQKAYAWYAAARGNLDALELKIESGSPEVLSWPWEALYSADDGYLAQHCCMERQPPDLDLPAAEPPEGIRELHILFIVSRPDTENKVGYHNLEREVIRYVREEGYAVTADVLRPPTFDELRRVLQERPGYYHIVHFDGHGGYGPVQPQDKPEPEPHGGTVLTVPASSGGPAKYQAMEGQLVFETDTPGEAVRADAVGAEKLGQLLNQCGVKMMVLNACQSAMIDGQAADPFASVAARLLKAGIPSVAAMGYSLYVSGAKQFVPAFYRALFHNGGPAGAMRAGRQKMYAHPERACFYGTAPLQDWMVPELYQQIPAGTRLLPHVGKLDAPRRDAFPRELRRIGDYDLIGRGREIHDLERILQRNRQAGILIHGMAGAGKTTLAKGFLHWLRDTGGLREDDGTECPVFWFEFQEIHSVEAVLNPLADALLGETARTMDAAEKLDALTERLRRRRVYTVWDNFESASGIPGTTVTANLPDADRRTLKRLLHGLRGGKTRIFITSRTEENWLSAQECARLRTLGGLEGDELWDYCGAVVRDLGLSIDREDADLKALLHKLDGNPLALRAVLLRLGEGRTARELAAELDADFTGAAGDEGTEQMRKAFRILLSGLDADTKADLFPVLQVLGLFEHYADADWVISILRNIRKLPDPDSSDTKRTREQVWNCFQILENAGLCTDESANIWDNLYRLHPALRSVLAREYPASENVRRWFVRYLAYEEQEIHDDAAHWGAVFDIQEANFLHAKTLAEKLDMREEDLRLTRGLAIYAHNRSRNVLSIERYEELAEKARRYGDFDMENNAYGQLSTLETDPKRERFWSQKAADMWSGAEELSADAYFTLGNNAEKQGSLPAAVEYYKQALAILERDGNSKVMNIYGILGEIARQQDDMVTAKKWHQKCYQMAKDMVIPNLQALASQSLGHIAAAQEDVKEALARFQEALEIFSGLRDPYNIADALNDIGQLLAVTGAYDSAKEYLMESARIAERVGGKGLVAANYNVLGRLSVEQNDYTSAKLWYAKAAEMEEAMGDEENAAIARRNLEIVAELEAGGGEKKETP